jgi:hypothetical protein
MRRERSARRLHGARSAAFSRARRTCEWNVDCSDLPGRGPGAKEDLMHVKRTAATAFTAALLLVGTSALAEDAVVKPPGGEVLQMDDHMTGTVGEIGDFPGRFVCLRSKQSFTPLSASDCDSGERVYALEMKGEKSLRPIQAGSKAVEGQLREFLGRDVRIQGKFHNETNTVIASSVRPADSAS